MSAVTSAATLTLIISQNRFFSNNRITHILLREVQLNFAQSPLSKHRLLRRRLKAASVRAGLVFPTASHPPVPQAPVPAR